MSITSGYLFLYNAAQALGWAVVLAFIVNDALQRESLDGAYKSAALYVCRFQLASFLEVIHAALGIVRSGAGTALMQWAGRSHVLFAVLLQVPEVQAVPAVFIMFAAWAVSEIIRYPQYALAAVGACPKWLTWLRYTAFILLYPIGVFAGEMWLVYSALPFVKSRDLYGAFFKHLPFGYHEFLIGLLCVYPLLWLQLYLHLFRQRRSKLGSKVAPKRRARSKRD